MPLLRSLGTDAHRAEGRRLRAVLSCRSRSGEAGPRPEGGDRFVVGEWVGEKRQIRLADALSAFECALLSAQRIGTHYVFLGAVEGIFTSADRGSALIYANRRYAGARLLDRAAAPAA